MKLTLTDSNNPHGSEALPKFLEKYGENFPNLTFINHYNNASLRMNCVAIYCGGHPSTYGRTINLTLPLLNVGNCFWDWRGSFPYFHPRDSVIRIKINRRLAGLYKPDDNILWLVDVTHHNQDTDAAFMVLNEICRILPIKERAKTSKRCRIKPEVTLGADPEFILKDDGKTVSASSVFNSVTAPIGCDGEGTQLELRPTPSTQPQQVVRSIRQLLKEVSQHGYEVSTNTPSYALGGHIHVGVGGSLTPSKTLLKALDDFLGIPTRYLTCRRGYGGCSNFETKPWGFEYRTPSAAIFSHPAVARIALKIVKNLVKLAIQDKDVSYGEVPQLQDYIKICKLTPKEAETFMIFTRNFQPSDNVLGLWKVKKKNVARKTYPLTLHFNDEWDDTVRGFLVDKAFRCRLPKPMTITLFGLKASRGDVCTIPVPGYEVIAHSAASTTSLGIARSLRVDTTLEQAEKLWRAIRKEVKELCA